MITLESVREIVAVYVKHGWILRRVLLSPGLKSSIKIPPDLCSPASVFDSDIDALWFSRPAKPGGIPWEIRHLSTDPYALLFTIDEQDAGFEESLFSAETILHTNLAGRKLVDKLSPGTQN